MEYNFLILSTTLRKSSTHAYHPHNPRAQVILALGEGHLYEL
jgi:hypothetical protein